MFVQEDILIRKKWKKNVGLMYQKIHERGEKGSWDEKENFQRKKKNNKQTEKE